MFFALKRGDKLETVKKIEMLKLEEIKPYKNNARKNDKAVPYVKESIIKFGFCNPILIDENNTILNGHTRYKAVMELGYTEVACTRLSGLTEKQKKALRLADNKSSEIAEWDFELLNLELKGLTDFDSLLGEFEINFDIDTNLNNKTSSETKIEPQNDNDNDNEKVLEEKPDEMPEDPFTNEIINVPIDNARINTIKQINLHLYDPARTDGFYQMPAIGGEDYTPTDLQGFNYVLNEPDYTKTVHFFLDDYQFERLWNRPEYYIERLKDYAAVLTPDFSLYLDMPLAMQVWNRFRSQLIGQLMQDSGLTVIPTLSWTDKASYEFCFDGVPRRSTVAISTIGVKQSEHALKIWTDGVDELIRRLEPNRILIYGGEVEYDFKDIEVVHYSNAVTERMKASDKGD